jgi:hypothetical protein
MSRMRSCYERNLVLSEESRASRVGAGFPASVDAAVKWFLMSRHTPQNRAKTVIEGLGLRDGWPANIRRILIEHLDDRGINKSLWVAAVEDLRIHHIHRFVSQEAVNK